LDDNNSFTLSREDWSLHRKGYEDQQRHEEKIKEVMKENIADLITEESIIMPEKDGDGYIKMPVRSLNQYKLQYNYDKMKHAGMGKGELGDIIARGKDEDEFGGSGKGEGAGDLPGEDYYEAKIDLAEIEKELFQDLELPNLEKKQAGIMETEAYEFNDIGRIGITGNIHKKKTLMAAFKRNALNGSSSFYPVKPEDVRYRTWNDIKKPDTKAVIFALMDTSGSMGIWEKYMARSFFFWTKRFLETKYESVEIVYISHHTQAKETDEHEFFHRGESGGTLCSTALRLANKIIDERYPPSQYNIYVYQASDGDNLTSDNNRCEGFINIMSKKINIFGYIEINQYDRYSTLMSKYSRIKNEKFRYYVVNDRTKVYDALKKMFRKEEVKYEY
jgi:hypothetical protein